MKSIVVIVIKTYN